MAKSPFRQLYPTWVQLKIKLSPKLGAPQNFGVEVIATDLKAEQEKRKAPKANNSRLTVENQIMAPRADYFDVLQEN